MADISQIKLPSGDTFDLVDEKSGYITGMTILSYGSSTWSDFIEAYNAKKVVYCRASSNANPASGSQTRLAFMAYVNNADNPTNVEFQYYRSVSSHTASQQGDQVFVYKLDKTAGWTVTTREASVKININSNNEGIETTYSNGVVSIGHANSVTAQTTQAVYPIAYDAQGHITSSGSAVTIPSTASDVGAIATTSVGAANGVAPLDSNSLIDEQYLPSYVDDVIEGYYYEGSFYEDSAHTTPITGETGKIYIDLTESKSYRWSGTVFVEINSGGHTYTAGNGIDISLGDVISVDTDDIQEKLVSGTNIKTVNSNSLLGSGNVEITRSLTQAQYNALSSAEKNNGTTYFITDGTPSGGSSFTPYSVETYTVSAGDVGTIHENTYLYKFGQVVVLNIRVASLPSGLSGEQIIANIPVAIAPENTIIQYPGMFGSSSTSQSPSGYVFVKADGTVGANANVINANTGIAANITWILNDN